MAVREDGRPVWGSLMNPAMAGDAWINHYYCKSREDFMENASRASSLDKSGIREPSRQKSQIDAKMQQSNDVTDLCAVAYFYHLSSKDVT